jgi:hypothetical protein
MQRWVGLGVIANNLTVLGRAARRVTSRGSAETR